MFAGCPSRVSPQRAAEGKWPHHLCLRPRPANVSRDNRPRMKRRHMNVLDVIRQTTRRAGGEHTRRRGTESFERSTKHWRTVEKPERVFRRMGQLGLHQEVWTLASSMAKGERFAGFNPLERIIGQSQLMSSFFLPLGAERARAVGRIVTQTGAGVGTGFLISPRLLMTNNHVHRECGPGGALPRRVRLRAALRRTHRRHAGLPPAPRRVLPHLRRPRRPQPRLHHRRRRGG